MPNAEFEGELQPISSHNVELEPQAVADEVCHDCLGHPPDGWSPLPPSHDADWGEHYHPLTGWVKWTPLHLASDDAPTGRHIGKGIPLTRSSWLNRRYHTSASIGAIWGGEFSQGTEADSSLFGVFRAGVDTSHFAGWEARFAFAMPNITNDQIAFSQDASADMFLFDLNVMYYPWGDSAWRPYTSMGFGLAYYRYGVPGDLSEVDTLFSIPLGIGVKHRIGTCLAMRAEITDYLTFGGDSVGFRNNLTATVGLEWHFGGRRPSYWPWNPGSQGY